MKIKKLYLIIIAAFLLQIYGHAIFMIFQKNETFSEKENRELAGFPGISLEKYFSGGFAAQFDSYISDHFPFRYQYVDISRKVSSLYYFEGFAQEDDIIILSGANTNQGANNVGDIGDAGDIIPNWADERIGDILADFDDFDDFDDIDSFETETKTETKTETENFDITAATDRTATETETKTTVATELITEVITEPPIAEATAVEPVQITEPRATEPPVTQPPVIVTEPEPAATQAITQPPATPPTQPPTTSPATAPAEEAESAGGGLLIIKDRLAEPFSSSGWRIAQYTAAVNKLYEECGAPETYVILPPCAAQLYLPDKYRNEKNDQYKAFNNLKNQLKGPVYIDLQDSFEKHKTEYLYFKTDHHWTALGAYYAYEAFITTMGMTPTKLNEYKSGNQSGFKGSLYKALAKYPQYESFKNVSDDVYYYIPKNKATVMSYRGAELTNGQERDLIYPDYSADTNLYNIFMGGDVPLGYIHSDVGNGKSILVIRDSYGHAFLPFLVDNFEYIYSIEPRYFNKTTNIITLSKFYRENKIDTLLFISYSLSATSGYWMTWGDELQKLTNE